MKLEHHEIGYRRWCETWVCLKEKLLRRVSLQDIEVRGIGFTGKHFLVSLYISKATREVKRMDQRPNQPMFLMRNVTWRPGATSMEQDYEMLWRAFLSGVPHPRRAWWQIPAPDGQRGGGEGWGGVGYGSPGFLFPGHWLPWQEHHRWCFWARSDLNLFVIYSPLARNCKPSWQQLWFLSQYTFLFISPDTQLHPRNASPVHQLWAVSIDICIVVEVPDGGGHGNPLQYPCLENPIDRGDWWATVCRVAKSWTWLKWLRTAQHINALGNLGMGVSG